ncbi:hypothetical protein EOA23_28920 [Mesorhizobium sp. M2A.F.Ca.ET.042.01.1.1]|uniref:hypothetical protein n=1 Tax=Mesorhizobium sp. M2A.F.Ca.ET.042.01.1.1 TaxID=2496745 RepID=UPI000FCCC672|nr:hypothetical protein [Mesorhizobium sp. M2A.F.Ca.ET.042.01.1.1]RUX20190.1 hypothetical protein EOA23_28920 [Mesorhizobium sp. M2A.F.Ca.ET.042.01.1.1]
MLAVAVIGVAGLVLRVLGARGDLWVDEIWNLALLEPLTSIDQIFWRINHDNNHFLNSIYLYLVGADATPLLQRGLSIALGVGAVFAAAAAARGRWAAVVTSRLFAISYPMVHYGSEARGYAGLVLFSLLAVLFLERRLDGKGSGIAFAAVVLLGFLSHLIMVETVAVLVAWTAWLIWRRTGSFERVNVDLGQIFAPAFLAVLPLAACMLIGKLLFGFRIGGALPFWRNDPLSVWRAGLDRRLALHRCRLRARLRQCRHMARPAGQPLCHRDRRTAHRHGNGTIAQCRIPALLPRPRNIDAAVGGGAAWARFRRGWQVPSVRGGHDSGNPRRHDDASDAILRIWAGVLRSDGRQNDA